MFDIHTSNTNTYMHKPKKPVHSKNTAQKKNSTSFHIIVHLNKIVNSLFSSAMSPSFPAVPPGPPLPRAGKVVRQSEVP